MIGRTLCSAIAVSAAALAPGAAAAGTYTQLYSQPSTTDEPTLAFFGPSGTLYGTTQPALKAPKNSPGGSIFALAPPQSGGAWSYATLYRFPTSCHCAPTVTAQDGEGNLYGFTRRSGRKPIQEIVFKFNIATKTLTTLYTLPPDMGIGYPAYGEDGNLYYTLGYSIYQLSTGGGSPIVIYTFPSQSYGEITILPDRKGNLFGALAVSAEEAGTAVYELNIASKQLVFETPVLSSAVAEGYPNGFVFDSKGLLWAANSEAGGSPDTVGPGDIYSFNPATQAPTVTYNFSTTCKPSCLPAQSFVMGPHDALYGVAVGPGFSGKGKSFGTLYSFKTVDSAYKRLYNFTKTEVGVGKISQFIAVDAAGAAYGTFDYGEVSAGPSVIWQITP